MRITLDTNVLVSATFWDGEASKIMELIEKKKVKCFLSKNILEEYNRVLHSGEIIEKTKKNHLSIKSAIIKVIEISIIVDPKRKIKVVKDDPDDNKILECAVEVRADYIVTYDSKHLLKLKEFEGIRIVSPTQFLKIAKKL